jgi:exopolysaccharide/PEP-CTERM locus tyrosine autokinase
MMHKPIRRDSLLERAAQAYDFGALLRQPGPKHAPLSEELASVTPEPSSAHPELDATFLAIPPELRAPVGQELPAAFYEAPELTDIAVIDRGMLAEAGMIVPGAPVGPLAEEFRLIKRQLLITRERVAQTQTDPEQVDKARTALVCSARPGDGKTFCAVNLALSMAAERDTEVLLVDADFAKPDVLVQLGLAEQPGLLDALADSRIDVEDLVIRTDVGGLSILPAGTKTATDTELLASARTRAVVARLLAANPRRIVIFDSPPALAASPAAVLAMLVGQVMLVVRADRTPETELREAVQRLDGCDEIALVLNAVSFVPGGHRYGTYYGQETGK